MNTKKFAKAIAENNPFANGGFCELVNPVGVIKVLTDTANDNTQFWLKRIGEEGVDEDTAHDACLYACNLIAAGLAVVNNFSNDEIREVVIEEYIDSQNKVADAHKEAKQALAEFAKGILDAYEEDELND